MTSDNLGNGTKEGFATILSVAVMAFFEPDINFWTLLNIMVKQSLCDLKNLKGEIEFTQQQLMGEVAS